MRHRFACDDGWTDAPATRKTAMSNGINEQNQAPAPVHEDVQRLKDFWETSARPLIMVAAILVLAFAAVMLFRHRMAVRKETASQLFGRARTLQDLDDLVSKYGSTPTGPAALLGLAKANYNAGNMDVALNKYIEFETRYPGHEMLSVATLGKAHCVEAKGDSATALSEFSAFVDSHPGHFLTPQAVLGKARCLDALGRRDEARVVYEDFAAADPESDWAAIAQNALEKMEKERRARTVPAPANASPDSEPSGIAIPSLNLQIPQAPEPEAAR
jgi:thioredoxin-like negative regulator of GroEL